MTQPEVLTWQEAGEYLRLTGDEKQVKRVLARHRKAGTLLGMRVAKGGIVYPLASLRRFIEAKTCGKKSY